MLHWSLLASVGSPWIPAGSCTNKTRALASCHRHTVYTTLVASLIQIPLSSIAYWSLKGSKIIVSHSIMQCFFSFTHESHTFMSLHVAMNVSVILSPIQYTRHTVNVLHWSIHASLGRTWSLSLISSILSRTNKLQNQKLQACLLQLLPPIGPIPTPQVARPHLRLVLA